MRAVLHRDEQYASSIPWTSLTVSLIHLSPPESKQGPFNDNGPQQQSTLFFLCHEPVSNYATLVQCPYGGCRFATRRRVLPSHLHPTPLWLSIAPNHLLNPSGNLSIDPVEFARPSLLGTRAALPRLTSVLSTAFMVFDEAVVAGSLVS